MKLFHNKIFDNSFYIPFAEVFSKGISFINILLFIRILTIDDFAIYSYVLAIVLWASVLMDGGITNLIYNKSLKKENENINMMFSAKMILSFLIIFLLLIVFVFQKPSLVRILLIVSFVVLFSSTSSLIKMFSRGNGYTNVDYITIISEPLIRFIFLIIIFLSADLISWQLYQVLLAYLIAGFLALVINYYKLYKLYKLKFVFFNSNKFLSPLKQTLKKSKYYLLYYLMIVGIGRIDIIFIEKYGYKNDLAIFSSALNVYQVAQLFFFTIITSQFLLLIKNKNYIYKYLIPILILIIVAIQLLSKSIYLFLFPDDYLNGYIVLNFISLALLPSVLNYYLITLNNYNNMVKVNFYVLTVFLSIKIGIYLFLKPCDLSTYYMIFPLIEVGILITYLMYIKLYESTSNK